MSTWVSLGGKKAKKSWRKRTKKNKEDVQSKARTPPPQSRNEETPENSVKKTTIVEAEPVKKPVVQQKVAEKKPAVVSPKGRITTPKAIEVSAQSSSGRSPEKPKKTATAKYGGEAGAKKPVATAVAVDKPTPKDDKIVDPKKPKLAAVKSTSSTKSGSISIAWTPRLSKVQDEEGTVLTSTQTTPLPVNSTLQAGAPAFQFPGYPGQIQATTISPKGLNPNANEFIMPAGANPEPAHKPQPIPLVQQQRIRETLKPFKMSDDYSSQRQDSSSEPRFVNGLYTTEHGANELSRRFGGFDAPAVPQQPFKAPPAVQSDDTPVYSLIKPYYN